MTRWPRKSPLLIQRQQPTQYSLLFHRPNRLVAPPAIYNDSVSKTHPARFEEPKMRLVLVLEFTIFGPVLYYCFRGLEIRGLARPISRCPAPV